MAHVTFIRVLVIWNWTQTPLNPASKTAWSSAAHLITLAKCKRRQKANEDPHSDWHCWLTWNWLTIMSLVLHLYVTPATTQCHLECQTGFQPIIWNFRIWDVGYIKADDRQCLEHMLAEDLFWIYPPLICRSLLNKQHYFPEGHWIVQWYNYHDLVGLVCCKLVEFCGFQL